MSSQQNYNLSLPTLDRQIRHSRTPAASRARNASNPNENPAIKPTTYHAFIHLLSERWNATQDATPASLPLPLPPYISTPLKFITPLRRVLLYYADTATHVSQKHLSALVNATPDALHIFFYPDALIDCALRSPIDLSIVTAPDIQWSSNDAFWNLQNLSSHVSLALQLELFFGKQKLQRRFVCTFKKCLQKLSNAWQNLDSPSNSTADTLAFDTLLRLLFLAFLQARGTLDHRTDFILQEITSSINLNKNIYDDFFRPLYFGTLNVPPSKRAARAKKFGNIPFLNGGLFQPTKSETQNPDRTVSNDVLLPIAHDILDAWQFSDHETRHADSTLDPMMLGHVFEMLMPDHLRSHTGSFYSPMNLVRNVVSRAFSAWLSFNCNLSNQQADDLVQHAYTANINAEHLKLCASKLTDIKILDMASGSGAFLQEAAELLHRILSAIRSALGESVHPPTLAKNILLNNIFGVDILESANRICELRLWLSTLKYYQHDEPLPPLPNLDLNIRCGHALIDLTQYALSLGLSLSDRDIPSPLEDHRLRLRYGLATGRSKQHLAKQIESIDRKRESELLMKLKNSLRLQIAELKRACPNKNLFDESQPAPLNLRTQLKNLQKNLDELESSHLPGSFSFDVHFPSVMHSGGFDLILGNPPWFSLHTRENSEQQALKRLYQMTEKIERNTPFHAQSIDVSALFVEKALRIIKTGGIVAMLLPNKLFNAPSYERFRRCVASHAQIVSSQDWSDSSDNTFDAAAYPADLILRRLDAATRSQTAWITQADACRFDIISSEPVSRALHAVPSTIGSNFTIKRGLRTNANDLFIAQILDPNASSHTCHAHFDALPNNDTVLIERALLYPILRGADISPFHAVAQKHFLMTHEPLAFSKPAMALPPHAAHWINQNKSALSMRNELGNKPPHAVFALSPLMNSPKVVWKDIADTLSACFVKDKNTLLLNSAYYIPVPDLDTGYLLSAFLNSTPIRTYCAKRAEFARGGYRRFFAWLIAQLPWPFSFTSHNDHAQTIIQISKEAHDLPFPLSLSARRQAMLDNCVLKAIARSAPSRD